MVLPDSTHACSGALCLFIYQLQRAGLNPWFKSQVCSAAWSISILSVWDLRKIITVSYSAFSLSWVLLYPHCYWFSQPKFTTSAVGFLCSPCWVLPQMRSLNFSFTLLPFWMETENSFITTSFICRANLEVTGTHPTFVLLDVHQITPSLWLCLDYFCLRSPKMNVFACYYNFTGLLSITPRKNIKILPCNLQPIIIFAFHLAQRE